MIVLPFTPSEPDQQFTAQIYDDQYQFRAIWNERAGLWYMSVAEIDGTPIRRSIALVLGVPLGRTSTHPLFRAGVFVAFDKTGSQVDAGLDDLGGRDGSGRVEVRYFQQDEAIALLAATGFVT